MKLSLERYAYGIASIAFGTCAIVWHDVASLHQLKALLPYRDGLSYVVGAIEILGGAAVLISGTTRVGAFVLCALYGMFALLGVPLIVKHPLVYNDYANFFEQLSYASGALILAASGAPRLARIGYYAFGICVLSFALEQLFYLRETASFVPKWIPPGQMFWAIATTAAFAAASAALLTGFKARLASVLNTAMLLSFGLLVWVPAIVADPHSFSNWSEGIITLVVAASAWVVAEYLA